MKKSLKTGFRKSIEFINTSDITPPYQSAEEFVAAAENQSTHSTFMTPEHCQTLDNIADYRSMPSR